MSRRRIHVRTGVLAAVLGLVCIGLAARRDPSISVLAGAIRIYHLLAGIVVAIAGGWLGARLPDLIEPAHSPNHRGFWHSKLVAGVLLIGVTLLGGGYVLGGATPMTFVLRIASLFVMVGYASHLALDHFPSLGILRTTGIDSTARFDGSSLAKAVLLFILALLVPTVTQTFWMFAEALLKEASVLKPLAIGAFLGVVVDRTAHSRMRGLYIYIHELTHAVAAVGQGRKVTRLASTLNGGFVVHKGTPEQTPGNIAISLAPYVFPLLSVLCVAVRPALPSDALFWFDVWIGVTVSFHLIWTTRSIWKEYTGSPEQVGTINGNGQGDIAKNGALFSGVYILVVGLGIWSIALGVLLEGYSGASAWAQEIGRNLWNTLVALGGQLPF